MKQKLQSSLLIVAIGLLLGCSKEVVKPCYTCTTFVTYSSNLITFKTPSPYTYDSEVCDETTKTSLTASPDVKVESITGTYKLTTTKQTVCVKKPI